MVWKFRYVFLEQLALKVYFFIQRMMFSQMSKREYSDLIDQNEILEKDPWGVKVLETSDNTIIKIFRLKRLFSSAYFAPYALRFKWNSNHLKKRGIETVVVDKIVYCREEQRHVLSYKKISGQPIKSILEKNRNNKVLLKNLIVFVAHLHDKGIYFRSLHFGNIIVKPDGEFALIDISNIKFFPFKLSINQRIRNLKHLIKHEFEKTTIDYYDWDIFFNDYAFSAMLIARDKRKLKLELSKNKS